MTDGRSTFSVYRVAKGVFFFGLPIVILAFIFTRIDFSKLLAVVSRTHPGLLALALLTAPLSVVMGGWRWQCLMSASLGRPIPFGFALRHYFIGLALGQFSPAGAAWDIYRVVVAGKQFGTYRVNVVAILVEKFVALAAIVALVAVFCPFFRQTMVQPSAVFATLMVAAYAALVVILAADLVFLVFLKLGALAWMTSAIESQVSRLLSKAGTADDPAASRPALWQGFRPLAEARPAIAVLSLSLGVQIASALGGYLAFRAIGNPVPFVVPLFLAPLLCFLFMLPVSLGSIGIREGAYLLLFGLVGVPAEAALAASFIDFFGMLINQAIGAALLLHEGRSKGRAGPA